MIKKSTFKPAWWLVNAHLQTLWPTLFRRQPEVELARERLELPDGDFIDVDWTTENYGAPIVLVLHGLGGSVRSAYAKGMLRAIVGQGWRGVFMHFRGCSGEPNRLPRYYHSGETQDVGWVVNEILRRYPNAPLAAVGFSMGGNILLKWLGETGEKNPLAAAVAISVPFDLEKAAKYIKHSGFSRVYQWWLLREVRIALNKKFKRMMSPIDISDISEINDFLDFDNKITAPLHGFENAHDYYSKASSRQYLKNIQKPTLILHSNDDPFMTKEVIAEANELSPQLTLELSDFGGHVGFITGTVPWKPIYWLEERIPEFLSQVFKKND